MLFNRNRADRDDREGSGSYLAGRSGRGEYWIGLGIALVVLIAFDAIVGDRSFMVLAGLLPALTTRRLHDFDRSGWWTAPVVMALFLMVALAAGSRIPGAQPLAEGLFALCALVFLIFVGAMPGSVGRNRFGAPPVKLWRPKAS